MQFRNVVPYVVSPLSTGDREILIRSPLPPSAGYPLARSRSVQTLAMEPSERRHHSVVTVFSSFRKDMANRSGACQCPQDRRLLQHWYALDPFRLKRCADIECQPVARIGEPLHYWTRSIRRSFKTHLQSETFSEGGYLRVGADSGRVWVSDMAR
jgi:hypothetical protein